VAQRGSGKFLLIAGFCLALAATFFFAYRAGRTARHGSWQNEPIRAWMSVPFVAHTHHTREETLFAAIGLPPDPHDHRPIRAIARARRVPVNKLIQDLEDAIDATPPPAKTPPGKPELGRAP
jgi:hypothetical protein